MGQGDAAGRRAGMEYAKAGCITFFSSRSMCRRLPRPRRWCPWLRKCTDGREGEVCPGAREPATGGGCEMFPGLLPRQ